MERNYMWLFLTEIGWKFIELPSKTKFIYEGLHVQGLIID